MNWKNILGQIAPVLASSIGGPFGGAAVKFIAGKLLGNEDASEEDLAAYIEGASPETLAQLRQLDQEFKLEMAKLGIRESELAVQDRESARTLASKNMVPHIVISAVYSLAYFLVLYLFVTGKVDTADNQELISTLISLLTAAQLQVLNFWFGSSAGSKEKTNRLNK